MAIANAQSSLALNVGMSEVTSSQISQDDINKAAWGACDTFRGVVDPSIYKDYVLTMLFLKYISDVWHDRLAGYHAEHGDAELVATCSMKWTATT